MNKLVGYLLFVVLGAAASTALASETPGSYTNYGFDSAVTGMDSVDFQITVKTDPGYRANLYWSNQFNLIGTGSGGYTGLQSNGGSDRMFLFSVWDATESKVGSDGSYCQSFGGEGTGQSCRIAHEWKQGHAYRFHVAYEGDQWLGVTVTDQADGSSFKLGSIRTAASKISPFGMVNWTEYFEWNAADASCYDQPYAAAEFALPSGDNGNAVAHISGTSVSKGCGAYSAVTSTADGSLQRNAIGNTIRGAVVDQQGLCLAASGGAAVGAAAISYSCSGGRNQAWVYAVDKTLRLQNNLCLQADDGGTASVQTCTAAANQQWDRLGENLRSVSAEQCLTTAGGAQRSSLAACGSVAAQQWQLPTPQP